MCHPKQRFSHNRKNGRGDHDLERMCRNRFLILNQKVGEAFANEVVVGPPIFPRDVDQKKFGIH